MSRMTRSFLGSVLALSLLAGCGTASFVVLDPPAMSAGSSGISIVGGKLRIVVLFNLNVNPASVQAKTNVKVNTPLANNIDFTWDLGGTFDNEMTLTSTADASTLLNAGVANSVVLQIIGSPDGIRSVSGRQFDQDPGTDGVQNYETTFSITPS